MSHCALEFHSPNDLNVGYFSYGHYSLIFIQQLGLAAKSAGKIKEDIMVGVELVGKKKTSVGVGGNRRG